MSTSSVFSAWDAHGDTTPFVALSIMYERLTTDCEQTAASYGFAGDAAFIDFLCTLGFRPGDDTPEPAWSQIATEATLRGFRVN